MIAYELRVYSVTEYTRNSFVSNHKICFNYCPTSPLLYALPGQT